MLRCCTAFAIVMSALVAAFAVRGVVSSGVVSSGDEAPGDEAPADEDCTEQDHWLYVAIALAAANVLFVLYIDCRFAALKRRHESGSNVKVDAWPGALYMCFHIGVAVWTVLASSHKGGDECSDKGDALSIAQILWWAFLGAWFCCVCYRAVCYRGAPAAAPLLGAQQSHLQQSHLPSPEAPTYRQRETYRQRDGGEAPAEGQETTSVRAGLSAGAAAGMAAGLAVGASIGLAAGAAVGVAAGAGSRGARAALRKLEGMFGKE